jgi:hypothetical protein
MEHEGRAGRPQARNPDIRHVSATRRSPTTMGWKYRGTSKAGRAVAGPPKFQMRVYAPVTAQTWVARKRRLGAPFVAPVPHRGSDGLEIRAVRD